MPETTDRTVADLPGDLSLSEREALAATLATAISGRLAEAAAQDEANRQRIDELTRALRALREVPSDVEAPEVPPATAPKIFSAIISGPVETRGFVPVPPPDRGPEQAAPRPGTPYARSRTVWGLLIVAVSAVLPLIAQRFGITLPPEVAELLGEQLVAVIQAAAALAGTILAAYGRIRADRPLIWSERTHA